jgi:hypothetical protein
MYSLFIPHSAIHIPHYHYICPKASTIVILADRLAGTKAAAKDRIAMKTTPLASAGHTRSTRSGTGFDEAGGIYVG